MVSNIQISNHFFYTNTIKDKITTTLNNDIINMRTIITINTSKVA